MTHDSSHEHKTADEHRQHHDHAVMVTDFQRRFWVCLALTVPILALSPLIQAFIGLGESLAFSGASFVMSSRFRWPPALPTTRGYCCRPQSAPR